MSAADLLAGAAIWPCNSAMRCWSFSMSLVRSRNAPRAAHWQMAKRSYSTTSGGTPPAMPHISRWGLPSPSNPVRTALLPMMAR